ncbi:calcium-binding protein, partial [Sphingomonas beigongshangi]|uniref:calcium-binding protein n=1 Tax=Sphingomonas beigongshangi TaxID=2782540 RepID=UPI00193C4BF2
AAYGIEQIKFADGTTWDRAAIQQAATSEASTMVYRYAAQMIEAAASFEAQGAFTSNLSLYDRVEPLAREIFAQTSS